MRAAGRGLAHRVNPFLCIRIAILAVLCVVISDTRADPDLWGHVRFGGDIAAAGGVVRVDPYSFTSDIPWTNHEWLAELAMWLAYAAAGTAGLVLLKLALLSTSLGAVLRAIPRTFHAAPVLELTVLAFAFGTRRQAVTVRPQLFSLALFALLLLVLRRSSEGRDRGLIAVPVMLAIWANVHGGWIVGLGTVCLWAALELLSPRLADLEVRRIRAHRWRIIAVPVAAAIATLATPYGVDLWRFLVETVSFVRADIQDWQPAWNLEPSVLALWLAMAAVAVALVVRYRESRPLAHYAIVVFFAGASLWVNRLDGFFALSVLILLPVESANRAPSPAPDLSATAMQRLMVAGVAAVVAAGALVVVARNTQCITMEEAWVPDAEAAAFVRERDLHGRLLVWFDWGEYGIWHFAPDLRVSMDGRRETVYSTAVQDAHTRFYDDLPGGADLPERLRADYIWLPKRLPIVPKLSAQGWHVAFDGPTSQILSRARHSPLPIGPDSRRRARCFPGP
jgi:hypothetical protein